MALLAHLRYSLSSDIDLSGGSMAQTGWILSLSGFVRNLSDAAAVANLTLGSE